MISIAGQKEEERNVMSVIFARNPSRALNTSELMKECTQERNLSAVRFA
jgi:hypothetical protein